MSNLLLRCCEPILIVTLRTDVSTPFGRRDFVDRILGLLTLEIGTVIRILRQARALKLKQLADAAGLSLPFLSLLESGQRQPSLDVMRRIASALGVPPETLVLLSFASDGSMRSTDERSHDLANSIQKLAAAEEQLRTMLDTRSDHETE